MKRSFLTALGIEKPVIDQIMEEHGATIELLKEKHEEKVTALNDTVKELKERPTPEPVGDGEEWKTKYDDLVEKHGKLEKEYGDYKTGIETEKTTTAKKTALREALKAAGANPDDLILEALENKVDLAALEMDGDKLKDAEGVVKPLQEAHDKYFGTIETRGADVANPPANNGNPYTGKTMAQLMEDANKNPDKINEIMASVEAINKPKAAKEGVNNG